MNRRGDWIQIFMVMFFALLCMIAFLLLLVSKNEAGKPPEHFEDDLLDNRNQIILSSLLKQPVENVDLDLDGRYDVATLADVIVMNPGLSLDKYMVNFVKQNMPEYDFYHFIIFYPDRTISVLRQNGRTSEIYTSVSNDNAKDTYAEGMSNGRIILPQGVVVKLIMSSDEKLAEKYVSSSNSTRIEDASIKDSTKDNVPDVGGNK